MTEPTIIHIISIVWKWLIAPVAIIGWGLYRKREDAMDKQIALTSQKIENLEKRVNEVEKNNAVIISKIDDIKEDSGEMKRLLSQINRRLINGS